MSTIMEKIWIVTQESNVNGEILFNSVPCASKEAAIKVMHDEITTLLNESHFVAHIDRPEDFVVEKSETSYYIEDMCDDYYEDIRIEQKVIQY